MKRALPRVFHPGSRLPPRPRSRSRPHRASLLFLLCFLAGGPLLGPSPATSQTERAFPEDDELVALLQERVEEGRAVGIVLGVREADGTTRVVTAGEAGEGPRPLGERSVFEIGSVTKAFTGILLADMARRGEVSLSDPVSRYLPADVRIPSRSGREITLFDLATHHSALPRLPSNLDPGDPANPYADYTVEEMYDFLSGLELEREIGSEYEYSNLGVGLLGHALSRAAGVSYEALVRERILEPLGMRHTAITLSEEMRDRLARGHDLAGEPAPLWDLPTLAGAGALRSDARDLLRFVDANLREPETALGRSMRVAREPRLTISTGQGDVQALMGLGWHIRSTPDSRIVWHNGGTGGYRAFVGFDPFREIGVVLLANSTHSADDIALHLLDPDVPLTEPLPERVAVEVPEEVLEDYVGEYRLAPELSLAITLEGGVLHVEPTNQPKLPVHPESPTEFFIRAVDARITFQRNESGVVTGLVLHQGGRDVPGRKIP